MNTVGLAKPFDDASPICRHKVQSHWEFEVFGLGPHVPEAKLPAGTAIAPSRFSRYTRPDLKFDGRNGFVSWQEQRTDYSLSSDIVSAHNQEYINISPSLRS